jgi:uncharacterized membrane protein YhiD involved in acid resistance
MDTTLTTGLNEMVNLGAVGVFMVILFFTTKFLFSRMERQIQKNEAYLKSAILDQKDFYIHALDKQEENCREENRIIREQVESVKKELRDYKNEDKKMVMEFVNTIGKKNQDMTEAVHDMSRVIKDLTSELKNHGNHERN